MYYLRHFALYTDDIVFFHENRGHVFTGGNVTKGPSHGF
jgi:hypothetical protein